MKIAKVGGVLPFLEIKPPGHPAMVYKDLAASP